MKSFKPLHALTVVLLLSGVLPGCALEASRGDASIAADVQARINQHRDVGPPDAVYVQVRDHVVYLSGKVSEGNMSRTAEELARQTPGVKEVVNTIFVTK
jgi:osmotically-inducible protein OsmY